MRALHMERQRSPSYPSLTLEQAIDLVGKIHKANRTNVISRETAAKDMGYAGLTGRSLTVLGSLAQYGLIEKAGKGDIKVARRAVEILHPIEESHRAEAIIDAALAPALFRTLHERFSEGVPSENALRSFLIQQSFNDVAIGPAISAFLETNAFAEKAKEGGRTGPIASELEESRSQPRPPEDKVTQAIEAAPPTSRTMLSMTAELNRISMNIEGDRVLLGGVFDLKGLRLLEKKIATLKTLLEVEEDDEEAIG
jgi:hypothetical protein